MKRRKFLKQSGVATSALAIGIHISGCSWNEKFPPGVIELYKPNIDDLATGINLNPYLYITADNEITIYAHKPEMGQGTFQSIPLLIAEELDLDLQDVKIKQPRADENFLDQSTGGSSSMRTMWEPMRKVGAAAREMLTSAATKRWNIAPGSCTTEGGNVINTITQEKLSYGSLVAEAAELDIPENPTLKKESEYRLIGARTERPDIPPKITGTANFGMDMKIEGMVYASIERSPCFTGTVKHIDAATCLAVPGVEQVVKCIRPVGVNRWEGVAVIASNYWAAKKGREALNITWDEPENLPDSKTLHDSMIKLAEKEGVVDTEDNNFNEVYDASDEQISAQYITPFLAHAPMEPISILADVKDTTCEIWSATQFPGWVRAAAATELKMDVENVTVHCPYMGGSFGRKGFTDFSLEGVLLSREIGKPVKIVWSREDDIRQSPMRPGSLNCLKGGLDQEGNLTSFQHKVVAPSFDHSLRRVDMKDKINPPWIMEPIGKPFYDSKTFSSRYVWLDATPLPLIWWRSVYSSTNVFGQECFIDELAHKAGRDPLEFRLSMLNNNPKYKRLLTFLADKARYNEDLPSGRARGIAITHCFESTAGQVIEVSKSGNGIKIEKVITAIDCGIAINPDNIKAQCEGSVIMGLTAAMKDPMKFENGRVVTSNFHDYRMLRIDETPEIETHIYPSREKPTGVGEPALPTVAPALANAIFNLTGDRIRTLPMDIGNVKQEELIG